MRALASACICAAFLAAATAVGLRGRGAVEREGAVALVAENLLDSEVARLDAFVSDVGARLQIAVAQLESLAETPAAAKGVTAKSEPAKVVPTKETSVKAASAKDQARHPAKAAPLAKAAAPVKTAAQIKAALAKENSLLTGLLSHLKGNIMDFNKNEQKGKAESEKILKDIKARLARDEQELKNPKITAFEHAVLVNQTKMEKNEVKYWTQGRDIQHSMFHQNLKMSHGLMSRVKTVLEAYAQAMTKGKVDSKLLHAATSASAAAAFVEMRADLARRSVDYRHHVEASKMLIARS